MSIKKIVIAPDSFKESLTAKEASQAIKEGLSKGIKNCSFEIIPMADGGEGTSEVIAEANNGEMNEVEVTGPLGNKVKGKFAYIEKDKLAVIEVAEACGLHLVPREDRNPEITTTYGVGELIKAALDKGAENIIIGLGGSATNDGGFGMLQALGAMGKDIDNNEIKFGGAELAKLKSISFENLDERIKSCNIRVACDVENPLVGDFGATKTFGPQKGANAEQLESLEKDLTHYGNLVKQATGLDVNNTNKAGAAGGLGAAFMMLNAKLEKGIDMVLKYTHFEERAKDADYIFTGEGSIDDQTKFGKTISGIAKISSKYN
ncbi:glycerate kinase, partial [Parabacteroides distasonis]|nr:glycerate kinase [Parabacteroides distasonis]